VSDEDRSPSSDPIARFVKLFDEAKRIPPEVWPEPTAFALGTVDAAGRPAVRILLLKSVDEHGFVFYTNFDSRKGRDLLATQLAALCFHWPHLEQQVRVEGKAERVSDAEADAYFATRPRGSQIGAWASIQSQPLPQPSDLEARVAEMEQRFAGQPVPRPPHWSGFRVVPDRIEFWRGMPSRLHERELYTRSDGKWRVERLYP
jgi:pyridoxamine 5'-phosphate oxidase